MIQDSSSEWKFLTGVIFMLGLNGVAVFKALNRKLSSAGTERGSQRWNSSTDREVWSDQDISGIGPRTALISDKHLGGSRIINMRRGSFFIQKEQDGPPKRFSRYVGPILSLQSALSSPPTIGTDPMESPWCIEAC